MPAVRHDDHEHDIYIYIYIYIYICIYIYTYIINVKLAYNKCSLDLWEPRKRNDILKETDNS